MYDFLILGGDERMHCLYKLLREKYSVKIDMWEDNINNDDVLSDIISSKNIILPVPSTRDKITVNAPKSSLNIKISDVENALSNKQKLFYALTNADENLIHHKNSYNLLKDNDYTLKNSNITAQIACELIENKYGCDIKKSNILICGYGKIAKKLTQLLKCDSNRIYVALRKKEYFDEITKKGCIPIEIAQKNKVLGICDIIINTVPCVLFLQNDMNEMKQNAFVADLASYPHGFEKSDKIKVNLLFGLPGKYSPQKEAEGLKEAVIKNL